MTQHHHLDESGDPGLQSGPSVSPFFVLAMVQLPNTNPLPELAAFRREFHLPSDFEIKYFRAKPHQKDFFFKTIEPLDFRVRAVVIDKANLSKRYAKLSGQELQIEFTARLTLRASQLDIGNDVLIIDGGSNAMCRALRVRLSAECRALKRERPFNKIVGGRSRYMDGLQLADMVAGAVTHYASGQEEKYFLSLEEKVMDLWWGGESEK